MTFDKIVGEVQHRANLGSKGDAVWAIQCTLQALGQRLTAEEAKDLGAQLPREIAFYLQTPQHGERLSLDDFFQKVSEREKMDLPEAIYHARVVIEVLTEAVSAGEMQDVRAQLPAEWQPLFEGGSRGERLAVA